MGWSPEVGEKLPLGNQAFGLREKLLDYCLDLAHEDGGPKALGFELILGITRDDADYLDSAIRAGILVTPIGEVRINPPHGYNCVVDLQVSGLRGKSDRTVTVRTIWEVTGQAWPPRLVSAFPRP